MIETILHNYKSRSVIMLEGIHQEELNRRAEAFLKRKRRSAGARIIKVLRSSPGKIYSPVELVCLSRGMSPTPEELQALRPRPIPLADSRARSSYVRRSKELLARQAAGDSNPYLDWELGFLAKELKRINSAKGGIKYIRPERDKAYHNLKTQLWRLFKAARREDPEVRIWLKRHVYSGEHFRWREKD